MRPQPGWPPPRTPPKLSCRHPKPKGSVTMMVLGKKLTLIDPPGCVACTQAYLTKTSTLCAKCGEPILPGTMVEVASREPPRFRHILQLPVSLIDCDFGIWTAGGFAYGESYEDGEPIETCPPPFNPRAVKDTA